ncbi:hypothetical protein [Streptomyces hoynatensis]|nr:hypothetical protein [Streptomyces hoynatensis]
MKRVFLSLVPLARFAREFGYGVHAAHALRHGGALDAATAEVVAGRGAGGTGRGGAQAPEGPGGPGRAPGGGVWEGPVVLPHADPRGLFDGPRP